MPVKTQKVSAIIPVYNEERTVGSVVSELLKCGLVSEVICVNGGSTDNSLSILKSFGRRINLIDFREREGKGQALAAGIEKAKGDIVLFMDADLIGLNQKHIKTLLTPMLTRNIDAVLAVPKIGNQFCLEKVLEKLFQKIDWPLTGERAYYRKDLLPYLEDMKKARFGVEILLNNIYKEKRVKVVLLYGLLNPLKPKKINIVKCPGEYLIEGCEVGAEVVRVKTKQIKKGARQLKRRGSRYTSGGDSPTINRRD